MTGLGSALIYILSISTIGFILSFAATFRTSQMYRNEKFIPFDSTQGENILIPTDENEQEDTSIGQDISYGFHQFKCKIEKAISVQPPQDPPSPT